MVTERFFGLVQSDDELRNSLVERKELLNQGISNKNELSKLNFQLGSLRVTDAMPDNVHYVGRRKNHKNFIQPLMKSIDDTATSTTGDCLNTGGICPSFFYWRSVMKNWFRIPKRQLVELLILLDWTGTGAGTARYSSCIQGTLKA